MHLLVEYWWVILPAMLVGMGGYVLVAGRQAEGGLGARARHGWGRWRALSRQAATLQARVVLSLFYFTLAAPFGLGRRLLGDPLQLRPGRRTWRARTTRDRTLADARRQY